MKILGIETATAVCSVAIVDTRGIPIERGIESKQMHSEKIILLVDECLAGGETDLRSLDGIAVSIGPGSFTGLRIGLSVAKGLAYSSGLPVCGIPTLLALARQGSRHYPPADNCIIFPMIDARRDEVFCAVYRRHNGELEELVAPRAEILSALPPLITSRGDVIVVGDGAGKFKEYCDKTAFYQSSSYIFPSGKPVKCSAVPVAEIGAGRIEAGKNDAIDALEPLYVKEVFTTVKKMK